MGRVIPIHELFRRVSIRLLFASVLVLGSTSAVFADEKAEKFVSIGSAAMTAVYYPVAKAICRASFSDLRAQGIWCSAEMTPGSAYNIEHIASGDLEFAIVQSDILFSAYKGFGRWHGTPATELRSVLSLYPELVTIVARKDANVNVLADIAGKRVSVGGVATGPRATWNLTSPDFDLAGPVRLTELREDETTSALCSGTVDVNFFVVGQPSGLVSSWLAACPSNFVALSGPVVDKLISRYPFYARGYIPTALYHVPGTILSFGPVATLITSASSDPRVVTAIAKAIMTHIVKLKAMHPALAELDPGQMLARTLAAPAPLHPAAAAAYKELGLMK